MGKIGGARNVLVGRGKMSHSAGLTGYAENYDVLIFGGGNRTRRWCLRGYGEVIENMYNKCIGTVMVRHCTRFRHVDQ